MNYIDEMKSDIREYLEDEFERIYADCDDLEELEEKLNDNLWTCDSVTGNASGSYYCNAYKAREMVFANIDTVREALIEFCEPAETIADAFLNERYEYLDVTARCYLLGQAIAEIIEEIADDFSEYKASQAEELAE